MLKRLEFMVSLFVKIATGILFVTAVYIPVFYGWNLDLHADILWQILILAAVCTAGGILLPVEGTKEVSRKSLLLRSVFYFIYVNFVVIFFGVFVEWFSIRDRKQLLGMIAAIAFVFMVVFVLSYWHDSREADRMNQKLKERKWTEDSSDE